MVSLRGRVRMLAAAACVAVLLGQAVPARAEEAVGQEQTSIEAEQLPPVDVLANRTDPLQDETEFAVADGDTDAYANSMADSEYVAYERLVSLYSTYDDVVELSDYGPHADGVTDDTAIINNALAQARGRDTTTVVHIPSGTYAITGALVVWPNTHIVADDDAVMLEVGEGSWGMMVLGAHCVDNGLARCNNRDTPCLHGGHTQTHDVTIEGGVWDANADAGRTGEMAIMWFTHGRNITLRNCTLTHCNAHMVNLSGSTNCVVEGCTFKDSVRREGEDIKRTQRWECVHLDSANAVTESVYPTDNTPVSYVTVENCTFTNVHAGVGCHNYGAAGLHEAGAVGRSSNVTVRGCTFRHLAGNCVNVYGSEGYLVENNVALDFLAFVRNESSHADVRNNWLSGSTDDQYSFAGAILFKDYWRDGEHVTGAATGSIVNNVITNYTTCGISINGSSATVRNNQLSTSINLDKAYSDIRIEGQSAGITLTNNATTCRNGAIVATHAEAVASSVNNERHSIAGSLVEGLEDQAYTGEAVFPQLKVTTLDCGTELVEGQDYVVSYGENIAPGTATVIISGTGNYSGTIEATFQIV